jgi:hypothetical protein
MRRPLTRRMRFLRGWRRRPRRRELRAGGVTHCSEYNADDIDGVLNEIISMR